MIPIIELEEKILREGEVLPGGILKVGGFLNQQIDTAFMTKMGVEGARLYKDAGVTKVLTVEASGIALAFAVAQQLNVPMVFAKKYGAANISGDVYKSSVYSFTHKQTFDIVVSKSYISSDDVVLICDDCLAKGNALNGLIHIVEQSGAELAGACIAIEKSFQGGGDLLREEGIRVESLAIIDSVEGDEIRFRH